MRAGAASPSGRPLLFERAQFQLPPHSGTLLRCIRGRLPSSHSESSRCRLPFMSPPATQHPKKTPSRPASTSCKLAEIFSPNRSGCAPIFGSWLLISRSCQRALLGWPPPGLRSHKAVVVTPRLGHSPPPVAPATLGFYPICADDILTVLAVVMVNAEAVDALEKLPRTVGREILRKVSTHEHITFTSSNFITHISVRHPTDMVTLTGSRKSPMPRPKSIHPSSRCPLDEGCIRGS